MNKQPHIVAVILSGGRGTRVQHQDKGLLPYCNKPLIQRVIDAISPQIDDIIISCNRHYEQYQTLGFDIVNDKSEQQYEGPIAGILAACNALKLEPKGLVLVVPCDTPNLPEQYVAKLKKALFDTQSDAAVVYDGERQQNLHCLIKVNTLDTLSDFFNDGGRAIKHWLAKTNLTQVDFSNQTESFANLNNLEQLI